MKSINAANTRDHPVNTSIYTFPSRLRVEISAFGAMCRKELIIMARYPVNFIASFGQIFLIVAVFVLAGSTFMNRSADGAPDVAAGVGVYGLVLFLFLSDTLWAIGYDIRNEQLQGTLEQLYLSPASKLANLASRVTNTLIWTGLLSIAGSILMARMIGRLPFTNPWLGLYLLILSLSGTFGMGFAFAAITLRIKDTAQTLANLLQFIFMIFCAFFFPFAALPPFLRNFSRLIPLSYSVDAFRSALMGFPPGFPELAPLPVEAVIITLFGLLMPAFGLWLYRRAEIKARIQGSLSSF